MEEKVAEYKIPDLRIRKDWGSIVEMIISFEILAL